MRGKLEVISSIEGGMNSSVWSAACSVVTVALETLEAVEAYRTASNPKFSWDLRRDKRHIGLSIGENSRCWRFRKSGGRDETY